MKIDEIPKKMSTNKIVRTEAVLNRKEYKSKAEAEYRLNMAYFRIFSDYFNILSQHPEMQKKDEISDIMFVRFKSFLDTVDLVNFTGQTDVVFSFMGTQFNFSFDKYRQRDELFFTLVVSSKDPIDVDGEDIYKIILDNAIENSDLKGSYIEMPKNDFVWKKRTLEKRGFNDIFLPEDLMSDLNLYVKVFSIKGKPMRYLMVGSPGTGKTESTLIIANELNKMGVTILKTPVCKLLKEKIDLACILSPTILLFDDLDLSIGSRSRGGYSSVELQEFLDALDGTDKIKANVGIIATTNSAHLLDLAAQRPGRFEKILCFDGLNKNNIGKIILKSLKYNFDLTPKKDSEKVKMFYNREIVEAFYNAGVSGAHVFNTIHVINLKAEMVQSKATAEWIKKEITLELTVMDKIRRIDYLAESKMNHGKSGIGFGKNVTQEDFDESPIDEDECCGKEEVPQEIRRHE